MTKKNDKRWVMGGCRTNTYVEFLKAFACRLMNDEEFYTTFFFSIGEGEAERWTGLCRTEMDLEYVSKV